MWAYIILPILWWWCNDWKFDSPLFRYLPRALFSFSSWRFFEQTIGNTRWIEESPIFRCERQKSKININQKMKLLLVIHFFFFPHVTWLIFLNISVYECVVLLLPKILLASSLFQILMIILLILHRSMNWWRRNVVW